MASSSGRITVDLFYDIISPYSYLAFEQLTRYSKAWKSMTLRLKPFSIAFIMKGSQNQPPALVPNKGLYMTHDLPRLSDYFGLPIRVPHNFPEVAFEKGTLRAMKFLTALDMMTSTGTANGRVTETVTRELWRQLYQLNEDVYELDSFRAVAKRAKVEEDVAEEALLRMEAPETKARLKQYTDEALEQGAFGAPTIVAYLPSGPQMLFGSDRIEILAHLLGEEYMGPLNRIKSNL
jgi:glutathione S-transferase kappa 1